MKSCRQKKVTKDPKGAKIKRKSMSGDETRGEKVKKHEKHSI